MHAAQLVGVLSVHNCTRGAYFAGTGLWRAIWLLDCGNFSDDSLLLLRLMCPVCTALSMVCCKIVPVDYSRCISSPECDSGADRGFKRETYLSNIRNSSASSSSDFPLLSSFMHLTIMTKNSSKSTVPLPAHTQCHIIKVLHGNFTLSSHENFSLKAPSVSICIHGSNSVLELVFVQLSTQSQTIEATLLLKIWKIC